MRFCWVGGGLLSSCVFWCEQQPVRHGSSPLSSSEPDVFALAEVVTSEYAENVLYCAASNFLEVKELAARLLQQLPAAAVGLQVIMCLPSILWELQPLTDASSTVSFQRGCVPSFRRLWTSVPAPNHLTASQQPTFSICCCPSRT